MRKTHTPTSTLVAERLALLLLLVGVLKLEVLATLDDNLHNGNRRGSNEHTGRHSTR